MKIIIKKIKDLGKIFYRKIKRKAHSHLAINEENKKRIYVHETESVINLILNEIDLLMK